MTSSQSRYSITAENAGQESLFVGNEWKFFAESALLLPAHSTRQVFKDTLPGIEFVVGTGGVTPAYSASITGSKTVIVCSGRVQAPKRFEILSPAEQIIAIRSLLGLNVLELANILHVQRPTIYSWQTGVATPHHENSRRLRYIHELAQRWNRLCPEPMGDWVRKPLDETGSTLAALLSVEIVDERAINEAFAVLKTKIEEEVKSSISVRRSASRFGYKDRSKSKRDSSLDRETLV